MASLDVKNRPTKGGIPRKRKHNGGNTKEDLSLVTFKGEVQTSPHKLARNGNLEELKRFLDSIHAMKVLDENGSTLLHAATEYYFSFLCKPF